MEKQAQREKSSEMEDPSNLDQGQQTPDVVDEFYAMKSCPKCGHPNHREAVECRACTVIFEKIKGLPLDPEVKATPRLVRLWNDVLADFESAETHKKFLSACAREKAWSFAEMKYENVASVQPQDEWIQTWYGHIRQGPAEWLKKDESEQRFFEAYFESRQSSSLWRAFKPWIPQFVAASLILTGLIYSHLSALVGLGVALLIIQLGIDYLRSP